MKLPGFLFIIIIGGYNYTAGQNCQIVDSFTNFGGIKIGSKIPDSLRKYMDIYYNKSGNDSTYWISTKALEGDEKLQPWAFLGKFFWTMDFGALKDGTIYSFSLQCPPEFFDSTFIQKKQESPYFKKVTDNLTLLFGQMTKDEGEIGWSKRKWECKEMLIELFYKYRERMGHYRITFENKKLAALRINEYQKNKKNINQ